jgi:Helicase associated domain
VGRRLSSLLTVARREGHARVPQAHVEEGIRLGAWVANQRTHYKTGRLSKDRATRLEALTGWTWNPTQERWEEGFRHLLTFVEEHGTATVPVDYGTQSRTDHPRGRDAYDAHTRGCCTNTA